MTLSTCVIEGGEVNFNHK